MPKASAWHSSSGRSGPSPTKNELKVRKAIAKVEPLRSTNPVILGTRVHSRDHAHAKKTGTPRSTRLDLSERSRRKTVPDHSQFLRRQSLLDQALGCRVGVTNHTVGPSEHRKLSAPLGGSKQVAQLALASNYDRCASHRFAAGINVRLV